MFELLSLFLEVGGAIVAGAAVGAAVTAILITIQMVYDEYVKPLFNEQPSIEKIDAVSCSDLYNMVNSAINNTDLERKKKQYRKV